MTSDRHEEKKNVFSAERFFILLQTPANGKKAFSLSICMPESGKSAHIVKNGTSGSIHPALYRYIPSTPRRTALNALCK